MARSAYMVRLSDAERATIESAAQAADLTLAAYLRTAALRQAKRDTANTKGMKP
jgi:hypothetical protein